MNKDTLKSILIEYDKKRTIAENTFETQKQNLYDSHPELLQIDEKLHKLSLSTIKEISRNGDMDLVSKLNAQISSLKKQKEDFLKIIGISIEDLKPHYECSNCKDTGYITINEKTEMCSCLKQKIYDIEYNKSNIINLDKQTFENFKSNFYSTKVDENKYYSDISPRENIELILKICHNFIDNFDNLDEKNLLFTGKTGLGKTFLSSCIANELLKQGKTVLYQTAPEMLDAIIDYRFGRESVSRDFYKQLLSVDLLIIDDLGAEGNNQMKFTELFNVINSRLLNTKNGTKTIISTNYSLQALYENYDERIVSRIVGNYNICYFFGEDIRFLNK